MCNLSENVNIWRFAAKYEKRRLRILKFLVSKQRPRCYQVMLAS